MLSACSDQFSHFNGRMIPNLSSEVGVAFTLLRDTNSCHDTSLWYSRDFVMPVPLSMHHQDWGKKDGRKVRKRREVAEDLKLKLGAEILA